MSRRTKDLPPLTGIAHLWREIRHHEAGRQILSVLLVIVSAIFGTPIEPLFWVAIPFVALGLAMRMWASGHIVKNAELATCGPYALVRHPLYTGNITLMLGFALASALWWSGLLVALILYTFYPVTITYEDKQMRRKFGDEWLAWAPMTPALLPNFKNWREDQAQTWSLKLSMRRNGEPVAAALMLYLMYVLASRII